MNAVLLQYTLIVGIVLLLAIGMVAAIGLAAHAGRNVRRSLFPWVFAAMGLGMIWTPIAGQRDLSRGTLEFMATAGEFGSTLWLSRMLTVIVMFIAASRIIGWVYAREKQAHPGGPLFIAFILVLVTHNFIAGAFGTKPVFHHNSLYPLLLVTAAYFSTAFEYERIIRFAKTTLFLYVLAGAAAALIQPGIAVQSGYSGLLPGIDFRYWGLGIHANTLGPLALLLVLLAWHQPFERRPVQWFAVGLALASLLLTQSKTAWLGGILAIASMALARFWPRLVQAWNDGRMTWGMAAVLGGAVLSLVAVTTLLASPETDRALRAFSSTATGASLMTLTGRVDIWAMAMEDWARNPLFGYGPTWGDLAYRLSVGNLAVVHAHNQFLHSLAAAGIIGLAASVLYLLLLTRYAIRGFAASRGLTAGLLAISLSRAMTEAPLTISNWGGAEVFIQLVTFVVVLAYGARQPGVAVAPSPLYRPATQKPLAAPTP